MYEDRPYELLKNMADKGVLVEINLTSNDDHSRHRAARATPSRLYRKFGVPVALSTDDEGVSRIDLTHEYVRAVETYGLSYADLKELVRNSIEYSFLPGASLWDDKGGYARFVADCLRRRSAAPDEPSSACDAFLDGEREGGAAMGAGAAVSGFRGRPLSQVRPHLSSRDASSARGCGRAGRLWGTASRWRGSSPAPARHIPA